MKQKLLPMEMKRKQVKKQFEQSLVNYNVCIDEENALHEQIFNEEQFESKVKMESEKYGMLIVEYQRMIEKFEEFGELKNQQKLEMIVKNISDFWEISEKKWYKWSASEIISWMEYKLYMNEKKLGNNEIDVGFDMKEILGQMKLKQMNGETLALLIDTDLSDIGIENNEIRDRVFSFIEILRNKYPML